MQLMCMAGWCMGGSIGCCGGKRMRQVPEAFLLPAWCLETALHGGAFRGKMRAEASARRHVARVHGGQSGTVVPCGEVQQVRVV